MRDSFDDHRSTHKAARSNPGGFFAGATARPPSAAPATLRTARVGPTSTSSRVYGRAKAVPGTQRALAGRGREARFPGSKAVDACLVLRPRDERGARSIPTTQACQPGPAIGHRAAAPLPEDSVDPEGSLQPPEAVAIRAAGHR